MIAGSYNDQINNQQPLPRVPADQRSTEAQVRMGQRLTCANCHANVVVVVVLCTLGGGVDEDDGGGDDDALLRSLR